MALIPKYDANRVRFVIETRWSKVGLRKRLRTSGRADRREGGIVECLLGEFVVASPSRGCLLPRGTAPRTDDQPEKKIRMITNSYEVNSKRGCMSSPTIGAPLFNDPLSSLLFATHLSGGSRNKRIRLGASSTWQSAAVVPYALLFRRPLHLYPRRLSLRNRPFHLCGPYHMGIRLSEESGGK